MKEKFGFYNALKNLFKYSDNNKKMYIKSIIFMILFVISEMLYKTFISKFLTNMVSLKLDIALNLIFVCALFRIFGITICHNQYRKNSIIVGERIAANLQKKLYEKVLTLSTSKFKKMESGKILSIIKSCESSMIKIVDSLLQESAYVATSIVMLFIIFFIDFKLAIGILIICFISLYLFKIELKKSKELLSMEYSQTDNYTTMISETSRGINDIKALEFENNCQDKFENDIDRLKQIRTKRRILGKTINTSKWTVRTVLESILLIYILKMLKDSIYTPEIAMLTFTYMDNIIDDIFHRIIEHDFEIAEFTVNIKRVTEILEDRDGIEIFGNEEHLNIQGKVELENVKFSYMLKDKYVLQNININIKPHTKNAIVGLSGEGKTTLFKLLLKEFDEYDGNIKFDDIDIKKFSKESFRKSITVVNQDPILFNMSIKDNLLIAKENATDDEIIKACKLANISEFIEKLPKKYNEIILENSSNLSGGQKQRIAIARAILRDTPIILFDEATSNLDNYSRIKIKETIEELSKTKTVIIISHTIDLVKDCDNIFYLENGYIEEQGTHKQLIERKGKYYNIINNITV